MNKKLYATLWTLTGLVAIGLLIVTVILAYRNWNQPQIEFGATLTSPNPTVYLRTEPAGSSTIVTILERGSMVHVLDVATYQNVRWMKIKAGKFTGWVPGANINFTNP